MAVGDASRPRRRFGSVIDALFGEARALERRRRRRYLMLALLGCLLVGAVALTSGGGRDRAPTTEASLGARATVSSAVLPSAGEYTSLAVIGGRLIVSGGPDGSLLGSGSVTSLAGGRAFGNCTAGSVDPSSLELTAVASGNCGDPALYVERVLPISSVLRGVPPGGGLQTLAVRIAVVDPAARDGYALGPVVVTYPQCSSCSVEWIYGNGSLWLFAPSVRNAVNSPGELLRVSEHTGRVQQHWLMPGMSRALLAVDSDGLWIAPSLFTGFPIHATASEKLSFESLYRVSAGMRKPARLFTVGPAGAYWMVASGHTVWLDVTRRNGPSALWRLRGASAAPTIRGRPLGGGPGCIQSGEGQPTMAGNAAIGLYCLSSDGNGAVIRVSPNAGGARTVASASVSSTTYSAPAAVLDGSFFFLVPATLSYPGGGSAAPVGQSHGVLYRITPR
jgi:hypothetical protein